ncbi:MAG: hypothetical protein AAGG44_12590 [Planctomycetota bacterium]
MLVQCKLPFLRFLAGWTSYAACVFFLSQSIYAKEPSGVQKVRYYGYDDCVQLENETTRVILCPSAGGRVLEYALNGQNVLYLPTGNEGWVWDGSNQRGQMDAGRFDIGPEQVVPPRPELWQGKWTAKDYGDYRVTLVSPVSSSAGVYLEREFVLAAKGSRLECTQAIVNASGKPVEYCHWSRTFAVGHGNCIIPVSEPRRFTEGYVRYDPPGRMLNMKPTDDHVVAHGNYLVVNDRPERPKLGFDSMTGWFAYEAPNDLLFVKSYETYPSRAYNEVAGLTISIWYPDDDMVELEPIGPRERLEKKGDRAEFTEVWHLVEHPFPGTDGTQVDEVAKKVQPLIKRP